MVSLNTVAELLLHRPKVSQSSPTELMCCVPVPQLKRASGCSVLLGCFLKLHSPAKGTCFQCDLRDSFAEHERRRPGCYGESCKMLLLGVTVKAHWPVRPPAGVSCYD